MTHDPRLSNSQGATLEERIDHAVGLGIGLGIGQATGQAIGSSAGFGDDVALPSAEEVAAAAVHRAGVELAALPAHLHAKIVLTIDAGAAEGVGRSERETLAGRETLAIASGDARYGVARSGDSGAGGKDTLVRHSGTRWVPWAISMAALIALGVTVVVSQKALSQRNQALDEARVQLAAMQTQVRENATLLATARVEAAKQGEAARTAMNREIELAQRLADATAARTTIDTKLRDAEVKIASLETPIDPATLQQTRTKLLEVPGTVRLAWSPFNLEGAAPAEQPNIQGDVVWNDELQTGYLRFVGLKANDPKIEQYQVWVIDERGLEQKVSGGVFNATAQGEVIVPITPGIDVGRVALFAITVEKPGGTWVPDLKRRVVVAPRPT